jgi:hypothetical protein
MKQFICPFLIYYTCGAEILCCKLWKEIVLEIFMGAVGQIEDPFGGRVLKKWFQGATLCTGGFVV